MVLSVFNRQLNDKPKMSQLNLTLVCVFVALAVAEAGSRVRRAPQFGQASASAAAFGGSRFPPGKPGFGGPGFGPGFGGPPSPIGHPGNFGRPGFGGPPSPVGHPGNFGGPGFGGPSSFGRPGFGGPGFGRGFGPSSPGGLNVNIAKSVSISSGRGGGFSSANAQARG